jgi:hypothetical protein
VAFLWPLILASPLLMLGQQTVPFVGCPMALTRAIIDHAEQEAAMRDK